MAAWVAMSVTIHMLQAGNGPAWVQAIGSILAILVAVAVPIVMFRQERRRYQNAGLGLAREAVAAINLVVHTCGIAVPRAVDAQAFDRDRYELTVATLAEYMKQFPVDRLGDSTAVKAFVRIAGAAGNAVAMGQAIQGGGGDVRTLNNLRANAERRLEEMEVALKSKRGIFKYF